MGFGLHVGWAIEGAIGERFMTIALKGCCMAASNAGKAKS